MKHNYEGVEASESHSRPTSLQEHVQILASSVLEGVVGQNLDY